MSKTDTVRARIKPSLKREVEGIFEELGINTSQAITMFYKQVSMRKGLPFDVSIPNETTIKTFEDTDKGINVHECSSVEDMFEQLEED